MKIALIITTYNRPDALELVIKSALSQTFLPDEIIIADDGSRGETKILISKYQKKSPTKIIHSWQRDLGFRAARSRNKAIAKSSSDYLILVDGDMILNKYFIYDHVSSSKEGFFIQGTRVLLSKEISRKVLQSQDLAVNFYQSGISNRKNALRSKLLSNIFSSKSKKLDGIKTCNMSFFKEDFLRINGFNNDFEGWGREDSEFALRMINYGLIRNNIKHLAIQYHLWHHEESRESLIQNDLILEVAAKNKIIRCKNGISEFI